MGSIKQLRRSKANRVLGGVCGGIGEYFSIDPVIVRVIYVLLSIGSIGLGVVVYIILTFVIPERDYV